MTLTYPTPLLPTMSDRRARLLVVDDQPNNIRLLHVVLSAQYEVFVATNGAQALQMCGDNPPDMVLLDVAMPGMDGLEVCRRLKAQASTALIPVIFVTGGTQECDENACWEAGAVDFVHKPVNPLTLRNRIRAHLQLKFHAQSLYEMALVDGLTGIANRRVFDEALEAEWSRASRDGTSLALLMIDVDLFKQYNDQSGHVAGDECLRRIARALQQAAGRPADLVARYGGEEFACLLPQTDAAGAELAAQRAEHAVRALGIAHPASSVAPVVTISIGAAAACPRAGTAAAALLQLADVQLYEAKRLGRGRVCFAQAPAGGGTLIDA